MDSVSNPQQRGALEGIRVIDLSRVLGGPYCAQILADHGADVIKVEPPEGDETRGWGPPFSNGSASYFLGLNRNKRAIAIDLSLPVGRQLLFKLVENADVLVENFKPGTLEKWGIGAAVIAKRFPRLIHCRVTGFGSDGPYGGRPGYDAALQALCGLMSVNGEKDGPPMRIGLPVVDMFTGLSAAMGVMLALQARHTSGEGQLVESALYDNGIALLHPHSQNYFLDKIIPERSGNAHPNIAPYDCYETAAGRIFLAVGNNRQFRLLCEMLGLDGTPDDKRFESTADRNSNREALRETLEKALLQHSAAPLAEELVKRGVPCAPVRTIEEALNDPHTAARNLVVEAEGVKGTASPITLSKTPPSYRKRPPHFAEHTDAILREINERSERYDEALIRARR